jgi:hypothetical protein
MFPPSRASLPYVIHYNSTILTNQSKKYIPMTAVQLARSMTASHTSLTNLHRSTKIQGPAGKSDVNPYILIQEPSGFLAGPAIRKSRI